MYVLLPDTSICSFRDTYKTELNKLNLFQSFIHTYVPNCTGNVLFAFPVSLVGMSSSAIHLASPVCMALGHVFQGGPLPLKKGKAEDVGDIVEGPSMMELVKCLRNVLEGSKDLRVCELQQ